MTYLPHVAAVAAWILLCRVSPETNRRTLNVLIGLDQLIWVVVTLGHGSPDETISAAAWRMEQQNKLAGRLLRPAVDALFSLFETDHCRKAYNSEFRKLQLPEIYRGD